jgi:hypothetical protein
LTSIERGSSRSFASCGATTMLGFAVPAVAKLPAAGATSAPGGLTGRESGTAAGVVEVVGERAPPAVDTVFCATGADSVAGDGLSSASEGICEQAVASTHTAVDTISLLSLANNGTGPFFRKSRDGSQACPAGQASSRFRRTFSAAMHRGTKLQVTHEGASGVTVFVRCSCNQGSCPLGAGKRWAGLFQPAIAIGRLL